MFFPRRSNLRNFLHYSAWPTGPERNNPKQNGAGLSRSGVRAGIFPQKFKRKGVAPVVFRHRLIPHRRNFVRAILKSTGHSGNQCCCWNSRANCSGSERRHRRWKCCSNYRRVGRPARFIGIIPRLAQNCLSKADKFIKV